VWSGIFKILSGLGGTRIAENRQRALRVYAALDPSDLNSSKGEKNMQTFNVHRVVAKGVLAIALFLTALAMVAPSPALAGQPPTGTWFVCPSVSTNNPNGMWVIGYHGAYYVNIPTQGGANADSKVYLTIPVTVPSLAQVPAGWGLYSSLPSYPNFVGMAVILQEGIDRWLGGAAGFNEGDMVSVTSNGSGYTATVILSMMHPEDIGSTVYLAAPIPLESAAVW
jgi:hypothetical protein